MTSFFVSCPRGVTGDKNARVAPAVQSSSGSAAARVEAAAVERPPSRSLPPPPNGALRDDLHSLMNDFERERANNARPDGDDGGYTAIDTAVLIAAIVIVALVLAAAFT